MEWKILSRTRIVCAVALLLGSGVGCQSESTTTEEAVPAKAEKVEAVVEAEVPAVPAPQGEAAVGEPAADAEADEDDLVLFAEGLPEEDGPAPLKVQFTVESLVGGEMDGPKFAWDFGDGSPPSQEASPTHVYENPGEYTVTIRVVDATGQRGWDEVEVEVYAPDE